MYLVSRLSIGNEVGTRVDSESGSQVGVHLSSGLECHTYQNINTRKEKKKGERRGERREKGKVDKKREREVPERISKVILPSPWSSVPRSKSNTVALTLTLIVYVPFS